MGEDRSEEMSRYTVGEAADILGISTGAVRNRLSRGTLRSIKEGRTVYVLLPSDMPRDVKRDVADTPGGMPQPDGATLTSELRDRLRYVEEQLEAERQAHAEARRLLMAALERIPPQLEASEAPEARESPESATDRQSDAQVPPETQGGAQRPWWRRVFGG